MRVVEEVSPLVLSSMTKKASKRFLTLGRVYDQKGVNLAEISIVR
jgi:hypothetical protein